VLYRAVPTASHRLPFIPRARAARKLLPLDVGLALSQLAIRAEQLEGRACERLLEGRVAEAFVGVQLLAANPEQQRALSFWTREGRAKSNAEVDYLISGPGGNGECRKNSPGSVSRVSVALSRARTAGDSP